MGFGVRVFLFFQCLANAKPHTDHTPSSKKPVSKKWLSDSSKLSSHVKMRHYAQIKLGNYSTMTLETHIINPAHSPVASVIWMHGLGAHNHDFDSLIPDLTDHGKTHLRFVFPNAPTRPITINHNAPTRAWYDIYSLTNLNREDKHGVQTSADKLSQLIQAEIDHGVPANRIILAGFSQGGAMALYTGMRQPHKIAGILGLSCYLPLMQEHVDTIHPANIDTPIFMIHGTHDMTLPIFAGKMGHDLIARTHKNIAWKEYQMQHEITQQEARDIHQWFLRVLDVV